MKKSFRGKVNDVANSFFGNAEDTELSAERTIASEMKKLPEHSKRPIGAVRPEYAGERKSKRYNLLLKPSIFEGLQKAVQIEGGSVNNLINDILEEYLNNNYSGIER